MTELDPTTAFPDNVVVAITNAIDDPMLFERLAQDLLFVYRGAKFQPVGGMHDGGADGIWQEDGKNNFFQFSISKDWKTKTRNTVKRIAEGKVGRPSSLSMLFPYDIEIFEAQDRAQALSEEFGFPIAILHQKYFIALVNTRKETREVFAEFVKKHAVMPKLEARSVEVFAEDGFNKTLVYLKHFATDLRDESYLETICYTHMVLFLADTNPDENEFKTVDEVASYVSRQMPHSSPDSITVAIGKLLRKDHRRNRDERHFRQYKDQSNLCLSHSMRQKIAEYGAEDYLLLENVKAEFIQAFSPYESEIGLEATSMAETALRCLAEVFRKQGMRLLQVIQNGDLNYREEDLRGIVQSYCARNHSDLTKHGSLAQLIYERLYEAIWRPSENQRNLCVALAKTYSLLFLGKADPQVIESLEHTARSLTLILGTDLVVKILAEVHLPSERQRFTGLIRSLKECGAKIFLTNGVLKETRAHLWSTMRWYEENVTPLLSGERSPELDELVDLEERYSPKILVRAFNRAKKDGKAQSLADFFDLFVGTEQKRFHIDILEFFEGEFQITRTSTTSNPNDPTFERITSLFESHMRSTYDQATKRIIAQNDAETVVAIYEMRKAKGPITSNKVLLPEVVWWLTSETKLMRFAAELESMFTRMPHIHPFVLIGLLSNVGSLRAAQDQLVTVLSTAPGVTMSHWIDDDIVEQITFSYQAISQMSPGKRKQYLGQLVEKVKSLSLPSLSSQESIARLLRDRKLDLELRNVAAEGNGLKLWNAIVEKTSDEFAQVYLFTEFYPSTREAALKFLSDNGMNEIVKGFRAHVLDSIGLKLSSEETEH